MSSKKDMRRADLGEWALIPVIAGILIISAIPYVDPPKSSSDADISSTPRLQRIQPQDRN
jgi:hypothetical protein